MTAQDEALRDIVGSLHRRGRRFALVGGLAVSVRAEVRFTRDVDIALVAATDDDVERLIRELRGDGYSPIAIVEHDTAKRIATRTSKRSGRRSPLGERHTHDVREDHPQQPDYSGTQPKRMPNRPPSSASVRRTPTTWSSNLKAPRNSARGTASSFIVAMY